MLVKKPKKRTLKLFNVSVNEIAFSVKKKPGGTIGLKDSVIQSH